MIQKAKTAQIGEIHEWHGVQMVKTNNGWEPVDENKKKKKTTKSQKSKDKFQKPLPDSKNYPPEQLEHFASISSDKVLKNVISKSKDAGLVEAARKEIDKRNSQSKDRGDYISFDGKDAFYREMYFKSYESQAETLSKDQVKALTTYQENGESINRELRKKDDDNYQDEIKRIDSCFDNFTIKHDIETMRVVPTKVKFFETLKEGDSYTDDAFCSTTINKGVLNKFSINPNVFKLTIRVPKGTNAIPMNSVKGFSENDYGEEEEILLKRNSKFKVISKKDSEIILQLL